MWNTITYLIKCFKGQKNTNKLIQSTHPNRFGIDDFVSILLIGGHIIDNHTIFTNIRFHVFFFWVAKLPVLEPAKIKVTSVLYMMVGCTELKKMVKVKFKLRAHPSAVTPGEPDFGVIGILLTKLF